MVKNGNAATHEVLANYSDWWNTELDARERKCFIISNEFDIDRLHENMTKMFDLGLPLTLGGKLTNVFKFMQEIEIYGNDDAERIMHSRKLVAPGNEFLKFVGGVMVNLYPSLDSLQLFVLEGSGWNNVTGVPKTVTRLIWTDVVVDKKRASAIFDIVLKSLFGADCAEINAWVKNGKLLSDANRWKSCLRDRISIQMRTRFG